MNMKFASKRVAQIPTYAFAELKKKKEELEDSGANIIDLGMGDPDLSTPQPIIDKMLGEIVKAENLKYPDYGGCDEFKEAVADFYKKNFKVELNPETEVLALIGSKEGIAHFIPTIIDPGEYVLVPDPSYPVYQSATLLASGYYYNIPLEEKNEFKPNLGDIPKDIIKRSKLMIINYPNNPTSSVASIPFLKKIIDFSKLNNIPVANDSAYNMVNYNGYRSPSLLEVEGAKECAVEFGSLSKTFNMTGWRIGFVVGNKEMIKNLSIYKGNVDTGQCTAIQKTAAFALRKCTATIDQYNKVYQRRISKMITALQNIGIKIPVYPKSTYFIWAKVPNKYTSEEFAKLMLYKAGVLITPGSVFGSGGEGYFRVAVSVNDEVIDEAIHRMEKLALFK